MPQTPSLLSLTDECSMKFCWLSFAIHSAFGPIHIPAQNIYNWSNHSTIHQTTKTQVFLFQKDKHICVCFPAISNYITWQITRIEPIPLLVFFPSGLIECEQLLLCSTLMIIVCSCVTNKQTQNYLNKQINNLNNWVRELVIMFHIDDDSAQLCALWVKPSWDSNTGKWVRAGGHIKCFEVPMKIFCVLL